MGESVKEPMLYYTHNVVSAVNLIEAMRKNNVKNVCCPSSALLCVTSKDQSLQARDGVQLDMTTLEQKVIC